MHASHERGLLGRDAALRALRGIVGELLGDRRARSRARRAVRTRRHGRPHWDDDQLLLDFLPGAEAVIGQVIARVDIDLVYVSSSFGAFLATVASELERGKRVPVRVE